MTDTPIAEYALLSDCHSAALVSRSGSIDWLCFPRFDKPAVFARLLDEDAGFWSITPTSPAEHTRRYLDRSMTLETLDLSSGQSNYNGATVGVGEGDQRRA